MFDAPPEESKVLSSDSPTLVERQPTEESFEEDIKSPTVEDFKKSQELTFLALRELASRSRQL